MSSLQNEYSDLAENLQAYFIQKDVKFWEISALKIQSGALYEFFKFSIFFASFLYRLLNFDATSFKYSKKESKNTLPTYNFSLYRISLAELAGLAKKSRKIGKTPLSYYKKMILYSLFVL